MICAGDRSGNIKIWDVSSADLVFESTRSETGEAGHVTALTTYQADGAALFLAGSQDRASILQNKSLP